MKGDHLWSSMHDFRAGAASIDISPVRPQHLAGYPHVARISTGVHDPLLSSALYLENGGQRALFIANDIIYVSKRLVARVRDQISQMTGIPAGHVLISATHTHSGPKMLDSVATSGDAAIPKTDEQFVAWVGDGMVRAALAAIAAASPAEAGLVEADATGIGTNRRDPSGPSDLTVPVLVVRKAETMEALAAMLVCNMHPTVLHEDSTLISGDFPGLARQYLQEHLLGRDCVILHHTGPAGNQSPRHVTNANTFEEAARLGALVGNAVVRALQLITYRSDLTLQVARTTLELPLREIPGEAEARARLEAAVRRLGCLRDANAPRTRIRTAETDVFGAEETLTLARTKTSGALADAARRVMPAEVQVIRIGPWSFVAWPGEMFVELAIELKKRWRGTYPIAYANGELQGYLVTREAVEEGGYESSNAIFKSPESGDLLLAATDRLIESMCP